MVTEVFSPQAEVDFLVENVLSMDVAARNEISRVLDVQPLALCPSDMLPYNRPRLAWVSKPVRSTEGVVLIDEGGFVRVHMSGDGLVDKQWLTEGWSRCGQGKIPTFMKSIPRWSPPERPAKLSRCSADAILRWQSDSFRFPPYQYELPHLVRSSQHELRYINSSEREILLGCGRDHTKFTMPAELIKQDEEAYEDKRLSLVGDSFSMLSFGWVISQLTKDLVEPLSPARILRRFGLAPGAGTRFDAPLDESLHYGAIDALPPLPGALVAHLSRNLDHTGSDVNVAIGVPFSLRSGNHGSMRAGWWAWKILFTTRWNQMEISNPYKFFGDENDFTMCQVARPFSRVFEFTLVTSSGQYGLQLYFVQGSNL